MDPIAQGYNSVVLAADGELMTGNLPAPLIERGLRSENRESLARGGPVKPCIEADKADACGIVFGDDQGGCELQRVRRLQGVHPQEPLRK